MALDRQKILNELGSVMNQLKSVDCGCMGKLFKQPGQNEQNTSGFPLSTCQKRGSCCGHGNIDNSGASRGESCVNAGYHNMHSHCMGHCNPPKLYTDTYNYLTGNLMQPVIKEVYDDLKNITPANTLPNNPLSTQMGLTQGKTINVSDNNMVANNTRLSPNATHNLSDMGPQTVNMFNSSSKQNYARQPTQPNTMGIMNSQQPLLGHNDANPYSTPNPNVERTQNGNLGSQENNMNNYSTQSNAYNLQNLNPRMLHLDNDPTAKQTASPCAYGMHTQGVSKFKEMFPGVMQGEGGDLGFDPMAIAIQMNPANQKQVAMDSMRKMIEQKPGLNRMFNRTANHISAQEPNKANLLPSQLTQENLRQNLTPLQELPITQTPTSVNLNQVNSNSANMNQLSQQLSQPNQSYQLQTPNAVNSNQVNANPASNLQYQYPHQSNQQTHILAAAADNMNRRQIPPLQNEINVDPLSEAIITTCPTIYEETGKVIPQLNENINSHMINKQKTMKEPILPVDNARYQTMPKTQEDKYGFNTLGQPVEVLPATMYHISEPALPQTLSPQPVLLKPKYSNVRATISKTSIIGNKPAERKASRNQLQNIYNQYKGSQSFTQQNITPSDGLSHSDELKILKNTNTTTQLTIERNGGDTLMNNQMQPNKQRQQMFGQIGDVPADKKPDTTGLPEKISPNIDRKSRNGLQDMVYTSYPTSTAWTFHGRDTYTAGYRYASRV